MKQNNLKWMADYYGRHADDVIREKGKGIKFFLIIRFILVDIVKYIRFIIRKILFMGRSFSYENKQYPYFHQMYNRAWDNERTVEIPIIREELKNVPTKKILEVGNVLSHHFHVDHTIVDKYEQVKGVINQDIVDYKPKQKYDLIVTISTLEHVGFDETPQDPEKVVRAISHLKSLLSKKGKLMITIPVNYNPGLDKKVFEEKIPYDKIEYLKRTSRINTWKSVSKKEVIDVKYGSPFGWANAVYVITIFNS